MSRRSFIVFSVIVDALLVALGYTLAFLIRFGGTLPLFNFQGFAAIAPFVIGAHIVALGAGGLYDPETFDDVWTIVGRTIVSVSVGVAATAAIAFFGGPATSSFARSTLLIALPVIATILTLWRYLFLRFGSIRWPKQRVLVVGGGEIARELLDELSARSHWGWSSVGIIDDGVDRVLPELESSVVGGMDDLTRIVSAGEVDRIVFADPSHLRDTIEQIVFDSSIRVPIDVVPSSYEVLLGTFDSRLGDIPLSHVNLHRSSGFRVATKRLTDIVGALLLLVVALPIFAVAALAIVLEDGAPVIYRQDRVGKGGRVFTMLKLRTMYRDAEAKSGPVLACEGDPRITKVGHHLRRSRIDELPQLINILRGDMSFVGPRPERPFYVEQYARAIPGYLDRHSVRPGVTGLAQVSGGYATTAENKLKYDLIYIFHGDVVMDLRIAAETLKVVMTGRGAN